ncbi:hypothetical protein [Actinomadura hibisca]|uniref:hypothetical protein n=1 Tax=Actinomadura hibisca TaxID=68565 RepID=UPI0008335CA8|nr:hypothetical protein [Actinomadura hibisca]
MTRSPRRIKRQVQETVGEQVRDLPLHAVRLAMFGVGRALLLSDRVTKDYKEITEGGGVKPVIGRLAGDVQVTTFKVVGAVVEKVRGGEEAEPAPVAAKPRPKVEAKPAPKPAADADKEISIGKPAAAPKPAAKPEVKPAAPAEPKAAAPAPKAEPKPRPAAKPEPKPEAKAEPKTEAKAKPAAKPEFEPKPELRPAAQAEAEAVAAELPVPDYDAATLPQLRARLRGLSADQVKLLREYEAKHAARAEVLKMYENRITKLNGRG